MQSSRIVEIRTIDSLPQLINADFEIFLSLSRLFAYSSRIILLFLFLNYSSYSSCEGINQRMRNICYGWLRMSIKRARSVLIIILLLFDRFYFHRVVFLRFVQVWLALKLLMKMTEDDVNFDDAYEMGDIISRHVKLISCACNETNGS